MSIRRRRWQTRSTRPLIASSEAHRLRLVTPEPESSKTVGLAPPDGLRAPVAIQLEREAGGVHLTHPARSMIVAVTHESGLLRHPHQLRGQSLASSTAPCRSSTTRSRLEHRRSQAQRGWRPGYAKGDRGQRPADRSGSLPLMIGRCRARAQESKNPRGVHPWTLSRGARAVGYSMRPTARSSKP
jgi:hypothetical protein